MDLQNKNLTTNIKILSLGFLTLVSLVITWLLIHTALYGSKTLLFWILPTLSITLSIAMLTLFGLVNSSRLYTAGMAVISLLTYIAIFPKDVYVTIGGAIFLVLMF